MTVEEKIKPIRPTRINTGNRSKIYCVRGHEILLSGTVVKGADVSTFEYFPTGFSRDKKSCYMAGSKLRGGNGSTFKMLNYCYATDGNNVWTFGGKIKGVDLDTFEVCDDGFTSSESEFFNRSGYAKDKNNVYFYCGYGKNKVLKKASPRSFISNNDGCFGRDDSSVFYHTSILAGCNPEKWQRLNGLYSRDELKVFHCNRKLKLVDNKSFEVSDFPHLYAKDNGNYFCKDSLITEDEFYSARKKS